MSKKKTAPKTLYEMFREERVIKKDPNLRSLDIIKRYAKRHAKRLGHDLTDFTNDSVLFADSYCKNCERYAAVEIDTETGNRLVSGGIFHARCDLK